SLLRTSITANLPWLIAPGFTRTLTPPRQAATAGPAEAFFTGCLAWPGARPGHAAIATAEAAHFRHPTIILVFNPRRALEQRRRPSRPALALLLTLFVHAALRKI